MFAKLGTSLRLYTYTADCEPVTSKIELLVFDDRVWTLFENENVAHKTKRELVLHLRENVLSGELRPFMYAPGIAKTMDRPATVLPAVGFPVLVELGRLLAVARSGRFGATDDPGPTAGESNYPEPQDEYGEGEPRTFSRKKKKRPW